MHSIQPSVQAFHTYEGARPFVASHKGRNSGFVAENTFRAFELALREGADILETDVSRTSDGQLFLMHGPNLDRYTDGSGPIAACTLEEIMQRHNRTNNGCTNTCQIVTLDAFLETYKGVCLINLDRCFDFLDEAYAAVVRHGMGDQVILKSGKDLPQALRWLREMEGKPRFMPIIKNDEPALDYVLETMPAYRYPAVELVFAEDTHRMIAPETVTRFHAGGVKIWINALTLSFPMSGDHDDIRSLFSCPEEGWGWLCDRGADVLQTDFVRELNAYLDERYGHEERTPCFR